MQTINQTVPSVVLLPNMRKNSDELNIESEVGKGTKVTMLTRFNP